MEEVEKISIFEIKCYIPIKGAFSTIYCFSYQQVFIETLARGHIPMCCSVGQVTEMHQLVFLRLFFDDIMIRALCIRFLMVLQICLYFFSDHKPSHC